MANTTNFGWETPDDTDLVKDGAAAIRTLAGAIDTSLLDLKGGTTDQVLAKNSGTDMDFKWVAPTAGDIEGVTAGVGISGGGTSGTVTVTNSMATEITAAGDIIVGTGSGTFDNLPIGTTNQVLTADTTVSPYKVKWATPVSGMTNPMTTTGDTIYSSSGSTPARLGIGSTGQVLTVAGGVPSWATPAAGGGTTFISRTSFSNVSEQSFDNVFDGSYCGFIIVIERIGATSGALRFRFKYGSSTETQAAYRASNFGAAYNTTALTFENTSDLSYLTLDSTIGLDNGGTEDSTTGILWVTHMYTGANQRTMVQGQLLSKNDASVRQRLVSGVSPVPAGVVLNGFKLFSSAANVTGAVTILGVKNS
jgi:hypothetical protein